jgi:DNA primase large subunit
MGKIMTIMSLISVDKYPFLKPLEQVVRELHGVSFFELISSNGRVLNEAKERVKRILDGQEPPPFKDYRNPSLVFYTEMVILSTIGDKRVIDRVLQWEAEGFVKDMSKEREEVFRELVKLLKVPLEKKKVSYHVGKRKIELVYAVNLLSYLSLIRGVRDEELSLSQLVLSQGYVFLSKQKLLKLIKYVTLERLSQSVRPITLSEVPETLRDIIALRQGKTPPCIEGMMAKKEKSPEEVKVLAVYKVNVGTDLGSLVSFLKRFGVENAEEYAKELLSSRRKYVVYSCEKMKEKGLCVADCGVKNPLQLYFGKAEETNKNL